MSRRTFPARMRRAHLLAVVQALPRAVTHRWQARAVMVVGSFVAVEERFEPVPTKRGRGGRR